MLSVGTLRQGIHCLDTLGHLMDGSVGKFLIWLSFTHFFQLNHWHISFNRSLSLSYFIGKKTGVYQCHDTGGNQEWTITKKGQIKHHDLCLTLVSYAKGSLVIMRVCDESDNQRWELREGGLLKHSKSNVCLDTRYVQERGITAEACNSGLDTQYWRFVNKHSWTVTKMT